MTYTYCQFALKVPEGVCKKKFEYVQFFLRTCLVVKQKQPPQFSRFFIKHTVSFGTLLLHRILDRMHGQA